MSQEQHEVQVRFVDGTIARATRTGNNAAWMCACGRREPLLGYSDSATDPKHYSSIQCPGCGRVYRVVAAGLKQVPSHVQELASAKVP